MSILDNLPAELYREIFSHLDCKALARTARVSRRLHALAESTLYHSLEPALNKLHCLVHTLLSRPILASYVRSLHVHWFGLPSRFDLLPVNNTLTKAANHFGVESPVDSKGTQLVLLLHILPRLDVLDIASHCSYETYDFTDFLNELESRPTTLLPIALQSVRVIHCYWWDRRGCVSPRIFMTMLRLPSIRTINIRLEDRAELDDADVAGFERSSEVTRVGNGYGHCTMGSLVKILRVPRVLREFKNGHRAENNWLMFNGPTFMKALEVHSATLECLELRIGEPRPRRGELDSSIGSLRGWPVLKRVTCSLTMFLGRGRGVAVERLVGVLPIGISELEITRDVHWTDVEVAEEVVHMLEMKGEWGLNRLRAVTIQIWRNIDEMEQRLKSQCDAAGVELIVAVKDARFRNPTPAF